MEEQHEIHNQEAFGYLLTKAKEAAPTEYGDSVPRALLGLTLQHVPPRERESWARFCYAKGHSLVDAAIDEMQRLRALCYEAEIDPDEPARR